MRRLLTTAAVAASVVLSAPLAAQGPGPRPGTAMVSGENPYIRLLDKAGGKTLTSVSFWRVHWSPVGTGHVCFVTVGEAGEAGQVRVALYDNERLYQYMVNDILRHTSPAYTERPFTAVGGATFVPGGDGIRERTESCRGPGYDIRLAWHDLQAAELIDILPGSRPTNPFGLTFLRINGTSADVTINGTRAPGTSFGGSALAFGESWLKK
ncbi:MAG: hypothetical protein IT361_02990 [Gemmatimonadaceae bacterium]|nr:hypothetical protein [Gemmatimonadaceae bacterium]